MKVFFLSLMVVGAYLASPVVGGIATIIAFLVIFGRREHSTIEKYLTFLIVSTPLYMTPIINGLPPLFSWSTIVLIFLSFHLLQYRIPIRPLWGYTILLFALANFIMAMQGGAPAEEVYQIAHLVVFILPVLIAFAARGNVAKLISEETPRRLLLSLAWMIAAMSIGVVVQWQLYMRLGLEVGHIGHFGVRTTYDLLLPAYSVLSGILSLGMVLGPILWAQKAHLFALLLPLLSVAAIIINSSRTGLVAGVVGMLLVYVFPPNQYSRTSSRLALIPVGVLVLGLYLSLKDGSTFRSTDLLDDNGRFTTFSNGWMKVADDTSKFFFGTGYANYPEIPPHNFIVETLVCSGIVVSIILSLWLSRILFFLKGSQWFYLAFTLLLAGMFFSGFYVVKAFTVVLLISIICKARDDSKLNSKNEGLPLERGKLLVGRQDRSHSE